MAKKWQQAGTAFCSAGNLHAQAGSRHDAATNYVDASNCFKKVSLMTFQLDEDREIVFVFPGGSKRSCVLFIESH